MGELIRRKFNWSTLSKLEQMAFISSILIWVGVALFGGGLYIAIRNRNLAQQAYAQATAIAVSATETPTPTATTEPFPVGWATATATITPLPTSTPTVTPTPDPRSTATPVTTPRAASDVQPTPNKPVDVEPAWAVNETETRPMPAPAAAPPDRLVIPGIELDAPVVPIGWYIIEQGGERYSIWQVADFAVSWHETSSLPGHSGNIVLNGHHNIKGEVFRYLVDLQVGDRVMVYVGDQVYHYMVSQRMILKEKGEPPEVRRQNAQWIAPTQDERLTMVTCWPYTNNTHRLVVVANPAPAPQSEGLQE
jgi:sortase A